MIQQLFSGDNKISMGRLLSFLIVVNTLIVFNIKVFMSDGDIGVNVMNACIWMIGCGVGGKAIQSGAEMLGKKKDK